MTPSHALSELLQDLFDHDELYSWLRGLDEDNSIRNGAPPNSTLRGLADYLVDALRRRGLINWSFWHQLLAKRRNREADIAEVARLWNVKLGSAAKVGKEGVAANSGGRCVVELKLEGDYDRLASDPVALANIIAELQRSAGDMSITVVEVRRGSVVLTISGSPRGLRRLEYCIEHGYLKVVGEMRIIEVVGSESSDAGEIPHRGGAAQEPGGQRVGSSSKKGKEALIGRAVTDPDFRARLLADPREVIIREGYSVPEEVVAALEAMDPEADIDGTVDGAAVFGRFAAS